MTSGERRDLVKSIKRMLFGFAIEALREGIDGNRQDALHLAETLEAMQRNPDKTPELLGIKRPRGRPSRLAGSRVKGDHFTRNFTIHALLSFGLDLTVAKYLSRAFRVALRDPPAACKAFGIDRGRGRGLSATQARYRQLAMDVYTLKSMGFAMLCSRKDEGILERVAKLRHCSVDTVERAWDMHRSYMEQMDAYEALFAIAPK